MQTVGKTGRKTPKGLLHESVAPSHQETGNNLKGKQLLHHGAVPPPRSCSMFAMRVNHDRHVFTECDKVVKM